MPTTRYRLAAMVSVGALALLAVSGCGGGAKPSAPTNASTASPSRESERIAFGRFLDADHTRGAIFTINPDGTGVRQVTHEPADGVSTQPDWSPDGKWIVYMEEPRGEEDAARLYKIHPDGTGRTSLAQTCTPLCMADGFPAWSPSGQDIAFQRRDVELKRAIFVIQADGVHARQVTQRGASTNRLEDFAPTWSPDGATIAFERHDNVIDHRAIFTVRADGTGLRQLTPWNLDAAQPGYSPNGKWILFRSNEMSDTQGNVWLVHPDGTGRHPVTHAAAGKAKWLSGSFSPDGRYITASSWPVVNGRQQDADVYVMNIDGSGPRNLTNTSKLSEIAPDWGPKLASGSPQPSR
jgi:TolB protein